MFTCLLAGVESQLFLRTLFPEQREFFFPKPLTLGPRDRAGALLAPHCHFHTISLLSKTPQDQTVPPITPPSNCPLTLGPLASLFEDFSSWFNCHCSHVLWVFIICLPCLNHCQGETLALGITNHRISPAPLKFQAFHPLPPTPLSRLFPLLPRFPQISDPTRDPVTLTLSFTTIMPSPLSYPV